MDKTDINFNDIELLVLDVDGVLTDGGIIYCSCGAELKQFHVRDGSGMKYWTRTGRKLAIITGRGGAAVERRAEELGVHAIRTGAKDKKPLFDDMLAELGVAPENAAVVGDDLTDLPLLRACGFPVAVADAAEDLLPYAAYVTTTPGGRGAAREVIEHILKSAGDWPTIVRRYLED